MAKDKIVGFAVEPEYYTKLENNVKKYGFKSLSEYVRTALDFFDERKYNSSKYIEIEVIRDCIKMLETHKNEVEKGLLTEGFKSFDENFKSQNQKNEESLKEHDENFKRNFKRFSDEPFKENEKSLKDSKTPEKKKRIEPFENVIQTLIRITHVKGKPSDKDFEFQATRCGKSKKEVIDYYDENYAFFIKESDKLL